MRSGENESANPFGAMQAAIRANGMSTPEQVAKAPMEHRRAAVTVARYARTLPWPKRRQDCRELLDMLGLLPGGDEATKETA